MNFIELDDAGLWGEDMTVCVAAICDGNSIIGASDRMLTAGNIQFQPPVTKIYQLTSSIALMVAGDMAIQAELILELTALISTKLTEQPPPDWFSVKDVADWYVFYYEKIKAKRSERELLKPLGLTLDTYISRQRELSDEVSNKLSVELINYTLPGCAAIIAGLDRRGPHLFVVNGGEVNCQDAAGFAAIGVGSYHASSFLMFSRHSKDASSAKTLWRTYTAKKRAEVAPGVGIETDMFVIGSSLGSYSRIHDDISRRVETIYSGAVKGHAAVDKKAEDKTDAYIQQIINQQTKSTAQTAPEIVDGESSPPAKTPAPE
jgi:hypothetical protein